jgi:DNA-binding MarR family transcriptional regulator
MNATLTTPERLIVLSLTITPNQSLEQLAEITGIRTVKYLKRIVRTLVMAGLVAPVTDAENRTRYTLVTR